MRGADHVIKKLELADKKNEAKMDKDGTSEWRDPEEIESKSDSLIYGRESLESRIIREPDRMIKYQKNEYC